jgi:hypothetical protein
MELTIQTGLQSENLPHGPLILGDWVSKTNSSCFPVLRGMLAMMSVKKSSRLEFFFLIVLHRGAPGTCTL